MNLLTQLIISFLAGLVLLLLARLTLKAHKKWQLTLTIIGAVLMSLPFLLALLFIVLILFKVKS